MQARGKICGKPLEPGTLQPSPLLSGSGICENRRVAETTSREVTLNGGEFRKGIPPFNPLNSGLGIIRICTDFLWFNTFLDMLYVHIYNDKLGWNNTFSAWWRNPIPPGKCAMYRESKGPSLPMPPSPKEIAGRIRGLDHHPTSPLSDD